MTGAGRPVAFFGTSAFAAEVLSALHDRGVEFSAVVSQPDRRSGRGRRMQPPPLAGRARDLGLPLVQTADASSTVPDAPAGIVVAFGQIIAPPLLGAYPLYNLHPSLLPRWRGAAPVERAIMAGDDETGVTVIDLVAELDAGPVHGATAFPIGDRDDAGAVRRRALEAGVPLLLEALAGRTTPVEQAQAGITYAHKLTATDRDLDWRRPAVDLDRRIRALSPHVGARTTLDGAPVVVWQGLPESSGPSPGEVVDGLLVGAGEGALRIQRIQPAGRRAMTAEEYLRGLRSPPRSAG
ncbi:MAG TPA: methionyl-tRNA formyltransferase [Gaiellales bacterium]|nr:methionyl-tRNA formyltransferase [Gaiellales bacterium]